MSLVPAIITLLVVTLVAMASARLVQDGCQAAARQADRLMARQHAEALLQQAVKSLQEEGQGGAILLSVEREEIAGSDRSDLGELPLVLQRLTAVGEGQFARVRLQADYALDACESHDDNPCRPALRRIAWRELSAE